MTQHRPTPKGIAISIAFAVLASALNPTPALASVPTCEATRTVVTDGGVDYVSKVVSTTTEACEVFLFEGDYAVYVIGGGGGGGGGASTSGGRGGGGGGGGGEITVLGGTIGTARSFTVVVGAGGAAGQNGEDNGASATDGSNGSDSVVSIGPTDYRASGGLGGKAGTSTGGAGGSSGERLGGVASSTSGGQGASARAAGVTSTLKNDGFEHDILGLSGNLFGSGGGGAESGAFGVSGGNNAGDGGRGGRGSLNESTYHYGYDGGAGQAGKAVFIYPLANEPAPVTACSISIEGETGFAATMDVASSDVNGIEVSFSFTGTHLYFEYVNEIAPESNDNGVTLVPQLNLPDFIDWINPGSSSQREIWRIYDPDGSTLICSLIVTYLPASSGPAPGGSGSSTQNSTYFVAEGFGKGKAKLTKAMKSFISKQLDARLGEKQITCTGTVRGKAWNPKREALALARAKAGCDYVRTLLPDVPVELKKRLISKPKGNPLTVRIRAFY
jgi:hypothetical protein